MVCASFTEEQKQKIINRKRYVKKDKAGISDISKDESELLGEPDQGEIFEGSQQELEQAACSIYQSPPKPSNVVLGDPRAQVLGLDHLSLRTPQHVPETPGTVLQWRIEKSLRDQFQEQMGSFQHSMMDAFNKLAATVTVSKHPQDTSSPQGDQTKSHSKPGPSSAPSPPRPRYQEVPSHEPMDTTTAQVGPELPPRLRAQYSDISSDPEMEPPQAKSVEKVKKHKDKSKYKSSRYVSSSSEASPHRSKSKKSGRSSPKQGNISSDRDQEKSKQTASTIICRDVRELDQERRRSHEVRRELPPDPIFSGEVDLSDLPSQYTDIESFRQVLGIPDPKHSMPVSNLIMGLNEEQEKQEARPKGPSTFLPANPALKEELTKWEQDFQNLNLTEGKFPKAPQATGKFYKMVDPCFEEKMQELNRKFGNICISPRPQAAPGVRAPLHVAKELEHQARQNICTLNFSAVFNHTISECSSVMDRCRDSIKSTVKKAKHQILKGADPERAIKNAYETTRDYMDIWDKRIQIQQRALACQSKAMTHMLRRNLHVMVCAGLMRRDAEMTNLHPDLGETRRQELRNSPFLPSPLFHTQLVQEGKEFLLKKGSSKSQGQTFRPYQNRPFRGPQRGRGCYRKRPYGQFTPGSSASSSRGSFSSRGSRGQFRPHRRGRGRGNPSKQ